MDFFAVDKLDFAEDMMVKDYTSMLVGMNDACKRTLIVNLIESMTPECKVRQKARFEATLGAGWSKEAEEAGKEFRANFRFGKRFENIET